VTEDRGPARPGNGWPGDPATAQTPVARGPAEVRSLAATAGSLPELAARESVCRACPRLVRWREQVAATRRRSFEAQPYWGRPVPGWGDDRPSIVVLGLAPAAHGGNRTGRIFTGDRSGDFLFASLFRCGLAAQPTSVAAGDGQRLRSVRMAAAVRCAPPDNKPEPSERDACAPWLTAELGLVSEPLPRPAFGHGVEVTVDAAGDAGNPLTVLGCYHPSQQNTFTGRVTGPMLDTVFGRARDIAAGCAPEADYLG